MAAKPRPGMERLTELAYERAATEYLYSLPLEHFMEATPQATQREITLASLALVRAVRSDVQVFNELLIQYPSDDPQHRIAQVVPDNMVILYPEPIDVFGSFNLPLQPVGPFLVMEYVSKGSVRKDYENNIYRYEQGVKAPYYLVFYPDNQELSLFHFKANGRYGSVLPNALGRLAIPELELEVAIQDHWMRYWFRGELLPLPGDLYKQLHQVEEQLHQAEEQLHQVEEQLQASEVAKTKIEQELVSERSTRAALEAELAQLRLQLEQAKTKSD